MSTLNISSFIWGIADDVLRDIYVRGKYRDVILPMTVIRRLDAVLEPTKGRGARHEGGVWTRRVSPTRTGPCVRHPARLSTTHPPSGSVT